MSKPIIEVEGFEQLQSKIKLLANDKDKRAEILLILRQVARPTLQVAQGLVPVARKSRWVKKAGKKAQTNPGDLKKSLGFITSKSENPTILVGPRAKGNFNGWYGHFVHDGVNIYHKNFKRKHKGNGINNHAAKSRSTGNPFLKNAFAATEGMVTADAEKKVVAFIQRRIDKLSK